MSAATLRLCLVLVSILPITSAAATKPVCENCDVIVIALDALQAAHVGHLGYQGNTTPNLDRLAKNGVTFTQAISPSSWTVPTYLSVFSSLFPSEHGLTNRYTKYTKDVKETASFKDRKPEILTMAQVFRAHGYRTGGFTGDSGVSAVLGYDKGFEVYTDETRFGGLENSTRRALEWLDKLKKDERVFLFVHGYDSHSQFENPSGFADKHKLLATLTPAAQATLREKGLKGEALSPREDEIRAWRSWYDAKIKDADARLGALLDNLRTRGRLERTLLIVFSDHGTEFFEHGRVDHGHSLYDELVRIPFVVSGPGIKPTVIHEQVTTLDLLPTVLDVTGVKREAALTTQIKGRSLATALTGGKIKGEDVFIETDYRNHTHKRALRSADGWKYIMTLETGAEELYNLRRDPREKLNLAEKEKPRRERMKKALDRHLDRLPAANLGQSAGCLPAYPGQCDYP